MEALRGALSRVAEWSRGPSRWRWPRRAGCAGRAAGQPWSAGRGIIAVCDFGGSGTSLTLADAAAGYQPVAATIRYTDFSGDRTDQALLNHVVADLSAAGSFDTGGTAAIGSLARLRAQCRNAKEQLSSSTLTTLSAELPGFSGDIGLTRTELEELIRQPLDGFVAVVQETLQRNQIRLADVTAVALVGGGLISRRSPRRCPNSCGSGGHRTAAASSGGDRGGTAGSAWPAGDSRTALARPPPRRWTLRRGDGALRRRPESSGARHWPGRRPTTIRASCRSAPASTRRRKTVRRLTTLRRGRARGTPA
ncbi:hsp70 family protein [Mycobacterium xenopi 4042]|uniref:Hsp70 family protein n=1 Tax=Mycobacterium xenopi 4042 TaxID=1299334 RepID=X8DBZ9_MYCXE|nr:hsp70 family protein [Mycobacterium xenopi 4042]